MKLKSAGLLVAGLLGAVAAQAAPVSRQDVLAAIAVLEHDITSSEAVKAADTITRFGRESDAVLLVIGHETLPWLQVDVPEAEARVRMMLTAAYFAGDIKSQLQKRMPADDPYSGWLAAIAAYRQIRKKQPDIVVPELEALIRRKQAGMLKRDADRLLREQQEQQPDNMI